MKNILKRLLVFFFLLAPVSSRSTEILVMFDEANPPFMYVKDNKVSGLYPAIIGEAFKRMKIDYRFTGVPWQRALSTLEESKAGVGGIYKTQERIKKYNFSVPLFTERLMLYVRKNREFPFKDVSDLKAKTVGVILGWSLGDAFDKARDSGFFTVEPSGSDEQNFEKLAKGRIDTLVAIREAGDGLMNKYNGSIIRLAVPLTENEAYLAFNKKSNTQDLMKNFDSTILKMKKDGSFSRLIEQSLK